MSNHAVVEYIEASKHIRPLEWLWPDWLPTGVVTVLAAESGAGKTWLSLLVAKSILKGSFWLDGDSEAPTGKVLFIDTEGSGGLIDRRVREADIPFAGFYRLMTLEGEGKMDAAGFQLGEEDQRVCVEEWVLANRPKLVVIDSLSGAHSSDENSAQEVKHIMQWLVALAEKAGTAILATHHLRKRKDDIGLNVVSLDRIRGSGVIAQFPKCIWALDVLEGGVRKLHQVKNNDRDFDAIKPIGYTISSSGLVPYELTAEVERETKLEEAETWLVEFLNAHSGMAAATEVAKMAKMANLASKTLLRAKKSLEVDSFKGQSGEWIWAFHRGSRRE